MSIKLNHKLLLIALMSLTVVSCQKEMSEENGGIDTGTPGNPPASATNKLAKGYYWYDGDTTIVADYEDTIQYNGDQISKMTRTNNTFPGDPQVHEFQYNGARQVSKIKARAGGFGYDYLFHYSPAGRLDSLTVYEVDNGNSLVGRVLTMEYSGDALRKVLSYVGVDRVNDDSVIYHRKNGKLDSFDVYHLTVPAGSPNVSSTKLGSSAVNASSFSDIVSSGYILTHSFDPLLTVSSDLMIQQFLNPKDLVLGNLRTRQVWTNSTELSGDTRHNYTLTPSNVVSKIVIEYDWSGVKSAEAFKFEYVK